MQDALMNVCAGGKVVKKRAACLSVRPFYGGLASIFIILLTITAAVFSSPRKEYKALVLHSHHPTYSWTSWVMEGIQAGLDESGKFVEVDIEYMYSKQFREPEYIRKLYDIYKCKYAGKKFDVIIATDDMAFQFLHSYRDELFGDVPFVFCGIDNPDARDISQKQSMTGIVENKTAFFTIELILKLHPSARRIILLNDGLLLWFRPWQETFKKLQDDFAGRVELVDHSIKDRRLIEAVDEIHNVYEDAPVILFECFRDSERTYFYREVADILGSRCKAPIYVFSRKWLDAGIAAGGNISNGYRQGKMAAELAMRILDGEKVSDIPIVFPDPEQYMFDYKQLKRFEINESHLPPQSVIVNQPTSFYYRYKTRLFAFVSVLAGLILIIFLLLGLYTLGWRASKRLLVCQAQLKSLASELVLSEERGRRKIAVELHDRISQSLIISKLNLGMLRESARSSELAQGLDGLCESLDHTIQNTRSLTVDLSSPVFYELSFEAAIAEWLSEHVERRHGIKCLFEHDGNGEAIREDIAIILFRMVHELLKNVIEHAGADKVRVTINKTRKHIDVIVEDNGIGFEPEKIIATAEKRGGLGLFGIRERLESFDGRLEISSRPLHGTRIEIRVPIE